MTILKESLKIRRILEKRVTTPWRFWKELVPINRILKKRVTTALKSRYASTETPHRRGSCKGPSTGKCLGEVTSLGFCSDLTLWRFWKELKRLFKIVKEVVFYGSRSRFFKAVRIPLESQPWTGPQGTGTLKTRKPQTSTPAARERRNHLLPETSIGKLQ